MPRCGPASTRLEPALLLGEPVCQHALARSDSCDKRAKEHVAYRVHVLKPDYSNAAFPYGVQESTLRTATHASYRGHVGPRSSMTSTAADDRRTTRKSGEQRRIRGCTYCPGAAIRQASSSKSGRFAAMNRTPAYCDGLILRFCHYPQDRLPRHCGAEESHAFILCGTEDLEPVSRSGRTPFDDDTTFPRYVIHRLRPCIEVRRPQDTHEQRGSHQHTRAARRERWAT